MKEDDRHSVFDDNDVLEEDDQHTVLDDGLLAGFLLDVHVGGHRLPASAENAVEALGQHPLVVEAKESREAEDNDDEADRDDDDDNVVRLLNFSFVAGLSARVAGFLRVLGVKISGEEGGLEDKSIRREMGREGGDREEKEELGRTRRIYPYEAT